MIKRFCVYFHKNPTSGEVFYVGKGTGSRPFVRGKRGAKWTKYVANNGGNFIVEIYKDSLTSQSALELEQEIINSGIYSNLVNTLKNYSVTQDIESINSSFYYDPSSPTFLRWKIKPKYKQINIGDVAGSLNTGFYTKVSLNGKMLNAHRVVWLLFNGEIPEGIVINHKDCNKSNNSIENLEAVTQSQNSRRTFRHLEENSEIGISFSKNKWMASVCINGEISTKSFAVSKYGVAAKQMALDYRAAMFIKEDNELLSKKLLEEFEVKYNYKFERDFPKGVSFLGSRFKAFFHKNGKEISKYFNINKLGYQAALDSAILCRAEMELSYDSWE